MAIQKEIEGAVFCGDFWERRGYIWAPLLNLAYDALEAIGRVIPVVMIAGNHDLATADRDCVSNINIFTRIHNVFDLDHHYQRANFLGGQIVVWGVPANGELKDLEGIPFNRQACNILALHAQIRGAKITNKYNSEAGIDPKELKRFIRKRSITRCFLGDIHLRQDIAPNIHYVGCVMQKSFADAGQSKGMVIYNTFHDSVKFRGIPNPEFHLVRELPEHTTGNYYRVAPKSYPKYKELVKNRPWNVQVVAPEKPHIKRSNIDLNTTHEDALSEYITSQKKTKRDQERLMSKGKGYLVEEKE